MSASKHFINPKSKRSRNCLSTSEGYGTGIQLLRGLWYQILWQFSLLLTNVDRFKSSSKKIRNVPKRLFNSFICWSDKLRDLRHSISRAKFVLSCTAGASFTSQKLSSASNMTFTEFEFSIKSQFFFEHMLYLSWCCTASLSETNVHSSSIQWLQDFSIWQITYLSSQVSERGLHVLVWKFFWLIWDCGNGPSFPTVSTKSPLPLRPPLQTVSSAFADN